MEIIKLYSDLIIKPLENEVKYQRKKLKKIRFSLNKKKEIEYLNKIECLLNDYYKKFTIIANKEMNNHKVKVIN